MRPGWARRGAGFLCCSFDFLSFGMLTGCDFLLCLCPISPGVSHGEDVQMELDESVARALQRVEDEVAAQMLAHEQEAQAAAAAAAGAGAAGAGEGPSAFRMERSAGPEEMVVANASCTPYGDQRCHWWGLLAK